MGQAASAAFLSPTINGAGNSGSSVARVMVPARLNCGAPSSQRTDISAAIRAAINASARPALKQPRAAASTIDPPVSVFTFSHGTPSTA